MPLEPKEPKVQATLNLTKRQVEYIESLARAFELPRNDVARYLIDLGIHAHEAHPKRGPTTAGS